MAKKRRHTNPSAPERRASGSPQSRRQKSDEEPTTPIVNEERLVQVIEERIEHYSGPLPHPDILRQFDEIVPGAAKTIIGVFVSQSEHRQSLERIVVKGSSVRANIGLGLGFCAVVLVLGSGMWLVNMGHIAAATVTMAIPLPALAGVFIYGKHSQRQERQEKARYQRG